MLQLLLNDERKALLYPDQHSFPDLVKENGRLFHLNSILMGNILRAALQTGMTSRIEHFTQAWTQETL